MEQADDKSKLMIGFNSNTLSPIGQQTQNFNLIYQVVT